LVGQKAFYSYAYPQADGFSAAAILPSQAFYHDTLSEFILPYDAVRTSKAPDRTLTEFLTSTYEAAASKGGWDGPALKREPGVPRRPRAVS
jgi:Family of unknown function (DUF5996)